MVFKPKWNPEQRAALIERAGELYKGGFSVHETARELEMSYGQAHRFITASGVPFRAPSIRHSKVRPQ